MKDLDAYFADYWSNLGQQVTPQPKPPPSPPALASPNVRAALPAIVSGKKLRSTLDATVIQIVTANAEREADIRRAFALGDSLNRLHAELDRLLECMARTQGKEYNGYLRQAHRIRDVMLSQEAERRALLEKYEG